MMQALHHDLGLLKKLGMSPTAFVAKHRTMIRFEQKGSEFELEYLSRTPETNSVLEVVTPDDVRAALNVFLNDGIAQAQLQAWAHLLIMMEEFDFPEDEPSRNLVATTLHLIATPEINGELTRETVQYYRSCLKDEREP